MVADEGREPGRWTTAQVFALLDEYWALTGELDPMLEGPGKTKAGPLTTHERWEHELMVGARTAISHMKSKLQSADELRAREIVDAQPWTGPRACCVAYLAELDRSDAEMDRPDYPFVDPATADTVRADVKAWNAGLRERITTGTYTTSAGYPLPREMRQCCPWDDRLDHGPFFGSYRALMKFADTGGDLGKLELGPIEVLPDTARYPKAD